MNDKAKHNDSVASSAAIPDTEENLGDLPQEITDSVASPAAISYAGVHQEPGLNEGGRTLRQAMEEYSFTSPELTGGDIDAAWTQAMVGDEAVGGTAATPDQDVIDEIGAAVGLEMDDRAFLRTTEILEQRDEKRWELEPMSSEDYTERREEEIS